MHRARQTQNVKGHMPKNATIHLDRKSRLELKRRRVQAGTSSSELNLNPSPDLNPDLNQTPISPVNLRGGGEGCVHIREGSGA